MASPNGRPRILFVTRHLPFVPSEGGITRSFHLVRAAAAVGEVTVVGAGDTLDPRLEPLGELCEVLPLPNPPAAMPGTISRVAHALRVLESRYWFGRPLGYLVSWARSHRNLLIGPDLYGGRATVKDLLAHRTYDVVAVEFSEVAGFLVDAVREWGGPSVVSFNDVGYVLASQMVNSGEPGGRAHMRQVEAEERQIVACYRHIVATSPLDAGRLERLVPGRQIDIVPNGVDLDYFGATQPVPHAAPTLVFTGLLNYEPNVDGLRYFLRYVWPVIRGEREDARFLIVGRGPVPEALETLTLQKGAELAVSVDDVRPYLAESDVAVVPLRRGSGTRLKILEALAAGVPVVSTTLGAEGLDLEPDSDLLVADTPDAFARAVLRLLAAPAEAEALARQGRRTVQQQYGWERARSCFAAILQAAARDA